MLEKTTTPTQKRSLGVNFILATLIVFLAKFAIDAALPPQGTIQPPTLAREQQASENAVEPLPTEPGASTPEADARRVRLAKERLEAESNKREREEKLQKALAAHEQTAEIARLDAERMEQAWKRFYVQPKKCLNNNDPSIIVECSNHHIRERNRFEKRWFEEKNSVR